MSSRDDLLFRGDLSTVDPAVARLVELEKERQARKLILIPSESSVPRAVREALGSVLTNVYAEGYPHPDSCELIDDEIVDYERYLAHYRRYGDRRYYRGVEYANVIETLARRRCAEVFATDRVSADQLCVNVQPLSGAPANTAVMLALLEPGDTFMAMALPHGGHLTHGDPVNLSGRLFNVISYELDRQTELLDYDRIEELAVEHRPRLIVAGYTSYPRQPDWARFRQIADRVGAYLMADIAHVAGMVIAGAYATPVGFADVVTFTTHKTLCGPRAACVLTADPGLACKIDRAVFPGIQGGPHVNKFAAMAVAFELAGTDKFRRLQHQIVANARALADALAARGLRLPCGGTDTHLLLVDCKTVQGRDGTPLMGHVAASILELAGVVVNRQKIVGDESAFYPSGIRLGTPWVTQRGLCEPEMEQIAGIVSRALEAIEPFAYHGLRRELYRGKIDFDVLQELRIEVAELVEKAGIDYEVPAAGAAYHRPAVCGADQYEMIEVEGDRAAAFVDQCTPTDVHAVPEGEWCGVILLERDGRVMCRGLIRRPGPGFGSYHLAVSGDQAARVVAWLRALSDGLVLFDYADPWAKAAGPVVVRSTGVAGVSDADLATLPEGDPPLSCKPYFVGLSAPGYEEPCGEPLSSFVSHALEERPLRRTPLHDWHVRRGAKMAPFAGWEMPLWYTSIGDEHRAVRDAAGLFDVAHMGVFEVTGPHASAFLDLVTTNDVSRLRPGESQYAYLLTPGGEVMDDVMVYALEPSRYLVVANAANAESDWAWLQAVNERSVRIDDERPWAHASFAAELRNLHNCSDQAAALVDLALQGPRSLDVLLGLLGATAPGVSSAEPARLLGLKQTGVTTVRLPLDRVPGGCLTLIVGRTGYTGEAMGFEIFVHPEAAPVLWDLLLEAGEQFGLQPIGLGARDSLRIEAGLPLYGHELAGPLDLRPDEAGFAPYVKLHKPFFVGRKAYVEHVRRRKMVVVRFRIEKKGVRLPRLMDVVVDNRGRVIGQVTSCAMGVAGHLVGQASVDARHAAVGTSINIFPHPTREDWEKPYDELELGDRLVLHSEATVVERFLKRRS
jgi:glycine hydroxymethyltransferase